MLEIASWWFGPYIFRGNWSMTSTMHIAENYLKVYILLTVFRIVAHFYILFFLHITGMPIRQIEGTSRRHAPPLHRLRLKNRLPSSNQIIFLYPFKEILPKLVWKHWHFKMKYSILLVYRFTWSTVCWLCASTDWWMFKVYAQCDFQTKKKHLCCSFRLNYVFHVSLSNEDDLHPDS
mgnify:CR=1 FL=1